MPPTSGSQTGSDHGPAGSVAVTVSPGFAIGDYILRPAKVMLVQGDD